MSPVTNRVLHLLTPIYQDFHSRSFTFLVGSLYQSGLNELVTYSAEIEKPPDKIKVWGMEGSETKYAVLAGEL